MTTTTAKRSKRRDPLVAELMQDYGCKTESELRSRLRTAVIWANKHSTLVLSGECMDAAESHMAEVGRVVSKVGDCASRIKVCYSTDAKSFSQRPHNRLLRAALLLFLFSHPVTRRAVESGLCLPYAELGLVE